MPPVGRARPERAVSLDLVTWRERADKAAVVRPRATDAASAQPQVRNAVRDLLNVDVDLSLLPADNAAYGFDNNADALTLSSALTERYLGAAA
jgi:hypothetical protein